MTTIKPFKSERAAKMAMTKAERAYVDARGKANGHYGRCVTDPNNTKPWEEIREEEHALIAEADRLYDIAKATYDMARSQNFWVKSWHFGCNPTRDLIRANMD